MLLLKGSRFDKACQRKLNCPVVYIKKEAGQMKTPAVITCCLSIFITAQKVFIRVSRIMAKHII